MKATTIYDGDDYTGQDSGKNGKRFPKAKNYYLRTMMDKIGKRKGFIILLYLNLGYFNITKSWICNVECMGVLEQTLFVCSDDEAYWSLTNWKPSLNVILHRYGTTNAMTWGTESYFEYLVYRAQSVDSILKENYSVFLVESDMVWLKKPLVLLEQYQNNDLILAANKRLANDTHRGALPAMAYFNATARTRSLWTKMVEVCDRKFQMYKTGNADNVGGSDMGAFNKLIRSEPIKVQWLPDDKFASGKWYRGDIYNEETAESIVVIHNNFKKGNDRKEQRAKLWAHWFLSDDGTRCTPCSTMPKKFVKPTGH
ncbi:uncharacterized protein [Ptychodera flava]|uniref:uncharacterized protein n=1 Tax=Ptychodera flava TaxID=63121 RepID=UPI003969EBA1